jgi:site-specific DNA recombinase
MSITRQRRALIYVRRSVEDKGDKSSLHYQEEMCRQKALSENCVIVGTVSEEVSAYDTPIEKRKGLQRVLDAALAGEFDVLVCWQKSRLVRDLRDEILILHFLLEEAGVEILFADPTDLPFTKDTADESVTELIQVIKTWSHSREVKNLRDRIKAHLRERAKNGEYVGGTYTGYKWNKILGKMEPIPREIDAVKLMFNWYLYEGLTVGTIAKKLNEQGYRTHNGKEFFPATVSGILNNKIYCGYYRWGFTTSKRRSKPVAADGVEVKVDWVEPIITVEEWQKVQEIMLDRTRKPRGSKRDYSRVSKSIFMLSGKIVCGCGRLMAAHNGSRSYVTKDGSHKYKEHLRYVCRSDAHHLPYKRQINSKLVDASVRDSVIEYVRGFNFEMVMEKARAALSEYNGDLVDERRRLEKRVNQLRDEIEMLRVNLARTTLSQMVTIYEHDIIARDQQIVDVERRIGQIDRDLEKITITEGDLQNYMEFLKSFEQSASYPKEKVQILFDKLVDTVQYEGDLLRVKIKWRIPIHNSTCSNATSTEETLTITI